MKYGSIEEGKSADIILLDLNTEVTNPIRHSIFRYCI